MAEVIKMPRLSDTMEEGNIVAWNVKVGDKVKAGDILAEVETDKATMELENYIVGTVLHIAVGEGIVPVDGLIAIIGDESEDWKSLLAEGASQAPVTKIDEIKESAQDAPKAVSIDPQIDERVKASPLAKKIAQDKGVSLQSIEGTGPGGRIVRSDVENSQSSPVSSTPSPVSIPAPITTNNDVAYGDMPVTTMRKVIAKRLAESKYTAPHFYLTKEINMDTTLDARKAINQSGDVKISVNDIVIKAVATALRHHPMINSSWMDTKIVIHQDINIGVAVAVPDGLIVPVIKHADRKQLSFINAEVKDLAGKARSKKLTPDQMTGNTFTISNLGMFGITEFTGIINPPDACILAVGATITKPVVKDGQIVVGNTMKVTLSCDHRVVDGATAAMFLQTLEKYLSNPLQMLV